MDKITLVHKVLIGIIIFLSILLLLIVLTMLSSHFKKFEFGSVSDWVSCISSVLTMYIAYLVYKEAPKWFEKEKNESGFNLAVSIMAGYDQQVLNIQKLKWDITVSNVNSPSFKTLQSELSKHVYDCFNLSSQLSSLVRWKIETPQEVIDSFLRLAGYYNQAYAFLIFKENSNNVSDKMRNDLEDLYNRIQEDGVNLKKDLTDIFNFPKK